MKAVYIIVNEGFAGEVVTMIKEAGSTGATIINARGSASELTFLNIPVEPAKEIVLTIVSDEIATKISEKMKDPKYLSQEINGIAFSLNVDDVNFINKLDIKK